MPEGEEQWTAVRIELPEPAADAISSFLFDEGIAAIVEAEGRTGRQLFELQLREDDASRLLATLTPYVDALLTLDPGLGPIDVTSAALPATDWQALFRDHHRPVAVGRRLLVAPPWAVPEAAGREVIVIEPAMAFGTGQHATTRACLEEIEAALDEGRVASALDVGTGSGVLAAAAARLGVARVVALDLDPTAVAAARETVARNAPRAVSLLVGGVEAVRGRFDLVLANLLADVLVAESGELRSRVAPGGRLVVSGILADQAPAVAAAFAPWRVTHARAEGSWRTLRLEAR